jgi:hypothetical protein
VCRGEPNRVTPIQLSLTSAGATSINQGLRQRTQEESRNFVGEQCRDGNAEDHLRDPPCDLVSLRCLRCRVSCAWIDEGQSPLKLPLLTWVIHCVDHDSSIRPVRPMLMHQRGDLRRLRLPSRSTVVLVAPLIPIITRPAVRLASTRYVFDPAHVLPARRRRIRNALFWISRDLFIYARVLPPI